MTTPEESARPSRTLHDPSADLTGRVAIHPGSCIPFAAAFDTDRVRTEAQSPVASSSQSRKSPEAEFIRLIYTARLRKYHHLEEHAAVRTKLVEEVLTALRRCKPRGVIDDIASMHWAITPTCCLALQMLYTHDQDGPIASSSPSGQRFNYPIYRVLKLTSPTTEYAHSWTFIPRLCHYT